MAEQHVEDLKKAREQMLVQRRDLAKRLGEPFNRERTEGFRTQFLAIQATIEAIARAIEDEEADRRSVFDVD